MKRSIVLLLPLLAAACTPEPGGFADGGDGTREPAIECERQDFSYLVQDIVDVSDMDHFTCDAPAASEDGPAFTGWFSPTTVVPGGLLSVSVYSDLGDDLIGRTVILDAPEELGHSRFVLDSDHMIEGGARFQVLMRHDLLPGPQTLSVALLDDYGDVEAIGPAVQVPVEVVELDVDPGPRGLRISFNYWSEEDPDASPDLDLQVFEPNGERLDSDNPESAAGGKLEYQSNPDCVPTANVESMSWPQDAERGNYAAHAFFHDHCGYDTEYKYTVTFSFFDRLIGTWDGETGVPGSDDEQIFPLAWVDLE